MYETALYASLVTMLVAVYFAYQTYLYRDRVEISALLFCLCVSIRLLALYFFFNTPDTSYINRIARSTDYLVSAPLIPLGLQMVQSNLAARVGKMNQIVQRAAHFVPMILLPGAAAAVFLLSVEAVRQLVVVFGVSIITVLFAAYITLIITNPFRIEKPEYSRGARLVFAGFLAMYLGEAIGAGLFRLVEIGLVNMALAVLLIAAGVVILRTPTFASLYTRFGVGFILVYGRAEIEMTNLCGEIEERHEGGKGMRLAEVVLAHVGDAVDRVFSSGMEITLPYTNLPLLDPTKLYQIEIVPHQTSSKGIPFSVLILLNDVTPTVRNKEAEQLASLLDDVLEERDRAELYLDLLGHDISNLLQSILLGVELTLENPDDKGMLFDSMEMTKAQIDRAVELVRDVKLMAEARKTPPDARPVSVTTILKQAVAEVQTKFPEKQVSVELSFHEGTDSVFAERMVFHCFSSILRHCIWTREDSKPVISVKTSIMGDQLQVVIDSNGQGIPDAIKPKLFDWRVRSNLPSAGVGLPLAKALAERYYGSLEIKDRIEGDYTQGPRFIVYLPLAMKNQRLLDSPT